jgi:hypothetical protein
MNKSGSHTSNKIESNVPEMTCSSSSNHGKKNKMKADAIVLSSTSLSPQPIEVADNALGREAMYRTTINTTPVIASNRIQTNEIGSGKRKSFLTQNDLNDLVNAFDTLCFKPNNGMKNSAAISKCVSPSEVKPSKQLGLDATSGEMMNKYHTSTHDANEIEFGLVEKTQFSVTANRDVTVKRSARIISAKINE